MNTSKHNAIVKGIILKDLRLRGEVGFGYLEPETTSLKWMFGYPQPLVKIWNHHPIDSQPTKNG